MPVVAPAESVKVDGEALKEKVFTVRVNVAVFIRLPEVPVTVTVALPPTAAAVAVKVKVLVPDPFGTGLVLNVPDTPEGKPLTESATGDENPLDGVTVIVLVAVPPAVIVVADVADIEKFPATVRVTDAVCTTWLEPEPLVAVN